MARPLSEWANNGLNGGPNDFQYITPSQHHPTRPRSGHRGHAGHAGHATRTLSYAHPRRPESKAPHLLLRNFVRLLTTMQCGVICVNVRYTHPMGLFITADNCTHGKGCDVFQLADRLTDPNLNLDPSRNSTPQEYLLNLHRTQATIP